MYTITRKNRIKEQLQLCHEDGSVALSVNVDLNVDQIASRVNTAYELLGAAQVCLQKDPASDEAVKAYGQAVIGVFDVIFGEENSKKILEFCENSYTEMLLDVFPFINDEIMPKIRQASSDRKKQLLEAVKKSRRFR